MDPVHQILSYTFHFKLIKHRSEKCFSAVLSNADRDNYAAARII